MFPVNAFQIFGVVNGETNLSESNNSFSSTNVISLDGQWLLATDPENVGRDEQWWSQPRAGAKETKVPWIIQEAFPAYHGVAWYWRDFVPPPHPLTPSPHNPLPHPPYTTPLPPFGKGERGVGGLLVRGTCGEGESEVRYLLRFWAVDYMADVWLNGVYVGGHEGGETPFVLDVTDAVKPEVSNCLAVRVLNPTHEPIDGIVLSETPRRNKSIPPNAGSDTNHGGIEDSVELLMTPAVRVEDLFVRADPKTGIIRIQTNIRNAMLKDVRGHLQFTVAPASSGETLAAATLERELPPGDTLVETNLQISTPHLWELNDPYLYRVTARVWTSHPLPLSSGGEGRRGKVFDERSVRCGFRDFRFEACTEEQGKGYFRLNGRRIFLRCSHTGNDCPIGLHVPHDPDLLRRDLINVKAMGFNAIRFIARIAERYQLDLCDEIGLMVYEECYAGWCLADSPKMAERFDRSIAEMIRRDRNHPSVVIWGLLNETGDGPVFRHAVDTLSLVRSLDDSRMVMLNSGRFDGQADIGSLSNPGSTVWENILSDQHHYPRVPHTAPIIQLLRTFSGGRNHAFLSEYGVGSAVDLIRIARHYEQLGAESLEDAQFYRKRLDRFMVDWERWNMAECFGRPEDYFMQCLKKMAGQRLLGLNAIRSNPNNVGYSLTGTIDQGLTAEGLTTTFRELKPGTIDALFDGFAPLRWCLFVEPVNLYRGTTIRLEAVLANEDMLIPGDYPVRLEAFGPNATKAFERKIIVHIPDSKKNPPFALPVFSEDVVADWPSGKYRFVATFERGGAAAGREAEFYVADPAEMPPVETEVVLWGEDEELTKWLTDHNIRVRQFTPLQNPTLLNSEVNKVWFCNGVTSVPQIAREVIIVSKKPVAPGNAEVFQELARHIARGSTAIFLSPDVFKKGDNPISFVPLQNKGTLSVIIGHIYLKDEWAKRHPIFDGLPAGGLMDYTFYREILPDVVWAGQDPPAEVVAGAIKASQDYSSGLLVSVYNLGAGRFILNALRILENLGRDPVAERLLRNMLRYAASDVERPLANLPSDFDAQLKAIGYLPS
jgi:beta-galactosidase/beta-glucuronidase